MTKYTAYAEGQEPREFDQESVAIAWVQQFEAGEVRIEDTDTQVWMHWPSPNRPDRSRPLRRRA